MSAGAADRSFDDQFFQIVCRRSAVLGKPAQAQIVESVAGEHTAHNTHRSETVDAGELNALQLQPFQNLVVRNAARSLVLLVVRIQDLTHTARRQAGNSIFIQNGNVNRPDHLHGFGKRRWLAVRYRVQPLGYVPIFPLLLRLGLEVCEAASFFCVV